MKCNNCGATFSDDSNKCSYCNTKRSSIVIDSKVLEKIKGFVKYLENTLESQKSKYDATVGVAFLFITIFWIFISYCFIVYLKNWFISIPICIIVCAALLLLWGFLIMHLEKKAFNELYESKLKQEIIIFLADYGIKVSDFKIMLNESLDKESFLKQIHLDL